MSSKRDLLRGCIQRRAKDALFIRSATMTDREAAEVIRKNVDLLASAVAFTCCDTYEFLEIADIMEWKMHRCPRG
jgi:hypothetical protein